MHVIHFDRASLGEGTSSDIECSCEPFADSGNESRRVRVDETKDYCLSAFKRIATIKETPRKPEVPTVVKTFH